MITITHTTRIAAPAMRVFLLSLSIDLHQESASQTEERAIAGVTSGVIGPDHTVTWQGRHFGILLRHTSRITRYEPPLFFEDTMIEGAFKHFKHRHDFVEQDGCTIMTDTLWFTAPYGPLGWFAERLILRQYMKRFLGVRDEHIKRVAESEQWKKFLQEW